MKIETKLDIGEYMWFMLNNKVEHKEIVGIRIQVVTDYVASTTKGDKIRISYEPQNLNSVSETRAFRTKAFLINSL